MTTFENWIKGSLENYIKHYTGKEVNVADEDVQHFAASVKSYVGLFIAPSLPSNLDEAAEKLYPYKEGYDVELPYPSTFDENKYERDAFKAGAKWRDAQIPKLPDNIDEAAEEYAKGTSDSPATGYTARKRGFKAGAGWMAGQVEEVLLIMAEKGLIPFKDGNAWSILLGENLQEGVSGFGDTITEAIMDFLKDAKAQGIIKETK